MKARAKTKGKGQKSKAKGPLSPSDHPIREKKVRVQTDPKARQCLRPACVWTDDPSQSPCRLPDAKKLFHLYYNPKQDPALEQTTQRKLDAFLSHKKHKLQEDRLCRMSRSLGLDHPRDISTFLTLYPAVHDLVLEPRNGTVLNKRILQAAMEQGIPASLQSDDVDDPSKEQFHLAAQHIMTLVHLIDATCFEPGSLLAYLSPFVVEVVLDQHGPFASTSMTPQGVLQFRVFAGQFEVVTSHVHETYAFQSRLQFLIFTLQHEIIHGIIRRHRNVMDPNYYTGFGGHGVLFLSLAKIWFGHSGLHSVQYGKQEPEEIPDLEPQSQSHTEGKTTVKMEQKAQSDGEDRGLSQTLQAHEKIVQIAAQVFGTVMTDWGRIDEDTKKYITLTPDPTPERIDKLSTIWRHMLHTFQITELLKPAPALEWINWNSEASEPNSPWVQMELDVETLPSSSRYNQARVRVQKIRLDVRYMARPFVSLGLGASMLSLFVLFLEYLAVVSVMIQEYGSKYVDSLVWGDRPGHWDAEFLALSWSEFAHPPSLSLWFQNRMQFRFLQPEQKEGGSDEKIMTITVPEPMSGDECRWKPTTKDDEKKDEKEEPLHEPETPEGPGPSMRTCQNVLDEFLDRPHDITLLRSWLGSEPENHISILARNGERMRQSVVDILTRTKGLPHDLRDSKSKQIAPITARWFELVFEQIDMRYLNGSLRSWLSLFQLSVSWGSLAGGDMVALSVESDARTGQWKWEFRPGILEPRLDVLSSFSSHLELWIVLVQLQIARVLTESITQSHILIRSLVVAHLVFGLNLEQVWPWLDLIGWSMVKLEEEYSSFSLPPRLSLPRLQPSIRNTVRVQLMDRFRVDEPWRNSDRTADCFALLFRNMQYPLSLLEFIHVHTVTRASGTSQYVAVVESRLHDQESDGKDKNVGHSTIHLDLGAWLRLASSVLTSVPMALKYILFLEEVVGRAYLSARGNSASWTTMEKRLFILQYIGHDHQQSDELSSLITYTSST